MKYWSAQLSKAKCCMSMCHFLDVGCPAAAIMTPPASSSYKTCVLLGYLQIFQQGCYLVKLKGRGWRYSSLYVTPHFFHKVPQFELVLCVDVVVLQVIFSIFCTQVGCHCHCRCFICRMSVTAGKVCVRQYIFKVESRKLKFVRWEVLVCNNKYRRSLQQ